MAYVKGCDMMVLSNYVMKKFEKGKLLIADGLKEQTSLEHLEELVAAANAGLMKADGTEDKGRQAGQVLAMIKKIDKKRVLIGFCVMKRQDGGPTDKTGVAAWFAESTDTYVMTEHFFAPGFEAEEEYFDECVLSHLKEIVSLGQAKSAEYLDKMVIKAEEKKILGITIGRTAFFLLIFIGYGLLFNNFGIGLCFAFLFTTSFTMITAKSKAKEEVIS